MSYPHLELTDEFIDAMKAATFEPNPKWRQGDLLKETSFSSGLMSQLAKALNLTLPQLEQRRYLAIEFKPEARDGERHPWGVYVALSRIISPKARENLLATRPHWTVQQMQIAVGERSRRSNMRLLAFAADQEINS